MVLPPVIDAFVWMFLAATGSILYPLSTCQIPLVPGC